jgi:L-malate glycosyltransferase
MKVEELPSKSRVPPTPKAGTRARRVLHLIGTFAQGGSERQAVELAGFMKERGEYDVELAVLDPEGILREEAERLGFPDVPSYPLNSFYDWNMGVQLRRFSRHLRAAKVDVVHTHDFYSNVFGMIAARLARVPVRIASRRELGGMRTAAQLWVERRAYAMADAIVANSEAVRRQLVLDGLPARKICVIHNSLKLERVAAGEPRPRPGLRASFGLPSDPGCPVVTIVANLRHAVKDHPTFLRAAQRVRDQFPKACFVLAGEGELLEAMRQMAAGLGIEENTFFLGRCERIGELLSASDVCVLSSRFEGFSNAILEYMAAAKPVVATNVGGAAEAIIDGQTGYLVDSGDDQAMADDIVRLLGNPSQARIMGERGRKVIEEEFSCERQWERTRALYSGCFPDSAWPRVAR